jgi:stage V sporulation protein SpoVS
MSDIIRFQANEPETFGLRFPEGKEVEGRFGAQVMFSTVDGRIFFVDVPVAARIHAMRLSEGEVITITKRSVKDGRKQSIKWEIERTADFEPVEVEPEQKPVEVEPVQKPALATLAPAASSKDHSTSNTNIVTRSLAGALCSAIDAVLLAAEYAKSRGVDAVVVIDFNAEDIRTLANTALISMQREQENAFKYRHSNGGGNGAGNYVNGGGIDPRRDPGTRAGGAR